MADKALSARFICMYLSANFQQMLIKSAATHSDAPKLGEPECKRQRINRAQYGGDADTTGAIAGMLAGALYGLEAIPDAWRNTLNSDIRRSY